MKSHVVPIIPDGVNVDLPEWAQEVDGHIVAREERWPTRAEFRRMKPSAVNNFFASIGVPHRVVDEAPATKRPVR